MSELFSSIVGWTLDSLQEWGMVMRLGISGAAMLTLEWGSFEVGFFVVGKCNMIKEG